MLNIKELRNKANITQDELARRAGVSQGSVAQWESGTSAPRAALLPKLAAALGCTIDDLYRDSLSTMDSQMIEHLGGRNEEGLR